MKDTLLNSWSDFWRARRAPRLRHTARHPGAKKKVNLALQGGGAHGAFTWGVLDHLIEDGRLEIEGISGASAGAVNAVMLADGLARGGRDGARARLAEFWRAASLGGNLPAPQRAVLDRMLTFLPIDGLPVQAWVDAWTRFLSPYDLNPLNINPLKELIERFVDFEAIRACEKLSLFISATNVHTGRLRVFKRDEISADVVMASAALPYVFRAVEIDSTPYWDGGYTGNPPIFPLLRATESSDVLVVQINPLMRHETPHSSQEILDRINEITFNSSLAAELRVIEFMGRLIDQGKLQGDGYRRIHMHRIVLGGGKRLSAGSRLNTDYDFFKTLHDAGQHAARRFLAAHFGDIGERSTIDRTVEVEEEAA